MMLFDVIQVYGYSLYSQPTPNNLIPLLNIWNTFKKSQRVEEAVETEIVMGYALLISRCYQQASEIFHKSAQYFLSKFHQQRPNEYG